MASDDPRLAELLGSLSLATDAAVGLGPETALRTALIGVRVAELVGVQGFELCDVYYAGVLRFIGCTAFAHEMAWWYGAGDDLAVMRALTPGDARHPVGMLARAASGINPRASLLARARSFLHVAVDPRTGEKMARAHCDLAVRLAARLGMSEGVVATLGEIYERWDGAGAPSGIRGDTIRIGARVLHIAWRLAAHLAIEGPGRARALLEDRAGSEFDPRLARLVRGSFGDVIAGLDDASVWDAFLAAEPEPRLRARPGRVREIAFAFAQFVDVKSPHTLGHSTGVAALVEAAVRGGASPTAGAGASSTADAGASESDVVVAALLHDLGRVAVSNGIWDKPGSLTAAERELARAHVYQTERILARTNLLSRYARLASLHHERLDGSGYHRGVGAPSLDSDARLLAAADVYHALTEERAYRPGYEPAAAATIVVAEARDGRLDRDAVDAVLAAAGHERAKSRGSWPCELSDREVDVIRLVARGLSNKEIGARLFISPKTVQRHMESIFAKTSVRSRAAAAVFAVERRLV